MLAAGVGEVLIDRHATLVGRGLHGDGVKVGHLRLVCWRMRCSLIVSMRRRTGVGGRVVVRVVHLTKALLRYVGWSSLQRGRTRPMPPTIPVRSRGVVIGV